MVATAEKTETLSRRMINVIAEAGSLAKKGQNSGQGNYAYHRIDDVEEHLRDLMLKHGIVVWPTVAEHKTETHKDEKGRLVYVVEATVDVTFENADDPEDNRVLRCFGQGIDYSDKGPGKAVSYALKTLYLPTFHLKGQPDNEQDDIQRPNGAASPGRSDHTAPPSGNDHRCPACGSGVWHNPENVGQKKPVWKCKNKKCTGGGPKRDGGNWPWASFNEDEFAPKGEEPQHPPADTPQYGPKGTELRELVTSYGFTTSSQVAEWLKGITGTEMTNAEAAGHFANESLAEVVLDEVKRIKSEHNLSDEQIASGATPW